MYNEAQLHVRALQRSLMHLRGLCSVNICMHGFHVSSVASWSGYLAVSINVNILTIPKSMSKPSSFWALHSGWKTGDPNVFPPKHLSHVALLLHSVEFVMVCRTKADTVRRVIYHRTSQTAKTKIDREPNTDTPQPSCWSQKGYYGPKTSSRRASLHRFTVDPQKHRVGVGPCALLGE